jgi:hypothetical protein
LSSLFLSFSGVGEVVGAYFLRKKSLFAFLSACSGSSVRFVFCYCSCFSKFQFPGVIFVEFPAGGDSAALSIPS